MKGQSITFAVFTGTGNTLIAARTLGDELAASGRSLRYKAIESMGSEDIMSGDVLGIALPVAFFSTYPTAWRFIDALPDGNGREAFLLATMGGVSGGMDGPIRRSLEKRNYKPVGSCIVRMPSNYNNKTVPVERNERIITAAKRDIRNFAKKLLNGSAEWSAGKPLMSSFLAAFAHTRMPWNIFYGMFPLKVDDKKCSGCGICADICPEKNISVIDGSAVIGSLCESCQRCCGFCPEEAIGVPHKPAERYRSITLNELKELNSGQTHPKSENHPNIN